jgi:DNA polymerase III sliding clamp (beta) subunit (PCNA family)
MKVNRAEFLSMLKKLQPGLSNSSVLDQSDRFIFLEDRVVTFNNRVSVSHSFVSGDIRGALRAKELVALLSKIGAKEVDLSLKDGKLFVKSGKSRAGIVLDSDITLPIDEVGIPEEWRPISEEILEAVGMCLFSVSKDMDIDPISLVCVHVNDNLVESCDNYRITRIPLIEGLEDELLIPADAAKAMITYAPIEYAVTDNNWIHFRTEDGLFFSCATMDEKYPSLDEILKVDGVSITLPEKLIGIMDKARIFSGEDSTSIHKIQVKLGSRGLVVRGEGPGGFFEEKSKVDYSGEELVFELYPDFTSQILKLTREVVLGDGVLKFEMNDFEHLLCCVKE